MIRASYSLKIFPNFNEEEVVGESSFYLHKSVDKSQL